MSLFEGAGKIPATVMEARYSPQQRVCLRVSASSLTNISTQYFSEALLLDQIPSCSAETQSGERRLTLPLYFPLSQVFVCLFKLYNHGEPILKPILLFSAPGKAGLADEFD